MQEHEGRTVAALLDMERRPVALDEGHVTPTPALDRAAPWRRRSSSGPVLRDVLVPIGTDLQDG